MTWEVLNLFGLINRFRRWRFRQRSRQASAVAGSPTRGGRAYRELVARVAAQKMRFDGCPQMPHGEIERQLDRMGKTWFEFSNDVRETMRTRRCTGIEMKTMSADWRG